MNQRKTRQTDNSGKEGEERAGACAGDKTHNECSRPHSPLPTATTRIATATRSTTVGQSVESRAEGPHLLLQLGNGVHRAQLSRRDRTRGLCCCITCRQGTRGDERQRVALSQHFLSLPSLCLLPVLLLQLDRHPLAPLAPVSSPPELSPDSLSVLRRQFARCIPLAHPLLLWQGGLFDCVPSR